MSRAIAMLAGLGAGYFDEKDKQVERERRARLDQITFDEAESRKAERKRQNDDRDALRAAGAPVPVVEDGGLPATMDNRDVGQEGEAPVAPRSYRVGANTFASRGAADTAATKQRTANVASALNTQDPAGAAARELQTLQIDAAKREQVNQLFDEGLNQASTKGIQGVLDYTNASGASPTQSRYVLGPDGKSGEIHVTLPDGTDRATGMTFTNDAAGARNAALFLSQKTPLAAKLQHFQAEAESARKGKTDEAEIKLKTAQAGYYDSLNDTKREIAAGKAAGAGRKADHFDEKEWDAAAKIEPSFVSFDDPNGGKPVESPELRLVYRTELNAARATGESAPNEAAESARTTTLKLRNAAIDRVAAARAADKNSTLTEAKAVRDILREFQAAQRPKPAAPPKAPAAPAAPTPAARAAQGAGAAAATQETIPSPPPQTIQQGLSTVPNPAYADWAARFGKAYEQQQAALAQENDAAASAARASFNPFQQNRVR